MASAAATSERKELSDKEFTKYLMNEDTVCPVCYRPYLPAEHEPQPGEEYVMPMLLDCNHAMCFDCCKTYYEDKVAFVEHGIRCQFHKRDQLGNDPYYCEFVSPRADIRDQKVPPEQLKEATENRIIAKVLRDTGVLLGTSKPHFEGVGKDKKDYKEFFYWYKYCRICQKDATFYCKKCKLTFCDDCWAKHLQMDGSTEEKGNPEQKVIPKHEDSDKQPLEEYEKEKIQSNKCSVCGKRAYKYCGMCKKFLCRDRKRCYDPCMDPDHLLIDFDPSIVELKRFEATAMDNARKMFIHDVHDYMETNPFLWQAADMDASIELCGTRHT